MPHYEDGIYVIVTVETYNEDELDMKMERLDELCTEAGAVEVLEADERIWKMRRNCQESVRLISLVSLTDDVVVPRDKVADAVKFVMKTGEKYPFTPLICAHVGDGNLHIVLCKCDLTDEEWEITYRHSTTKFIPMLTALADGLPVNTALVPRNLPKWKIYPSGRTEFNAYH